MMSNIFSILSIVCFALAGILAIAAVVLFFALDVRGVYEELQGRAPVKKERRKKEKPQKETPTQTDRETPTLVQDEAVTVLDNGELDLDSLVTYYEPGTEFGEETTALDAEQPTAAEIGETEMPTVMGEEEVPTALEDTPEEALTSLEEADTAADQTQTGFVLQKDIVLTNREKALYQLI